MGFVMNWMFEPETGAYRYAGELENGWVLFLRPAPGGWRAWAQRVRTGPKSHMQKTFGVDRGDTVRAKELALAWAHQLN